MLQELHAILDIQEIDMKMLRLMRLKKERLRELKHIEELRQELRQQQAEKEREIAEASRTIAAQEEKILTIKEKLRKLETRQTSIKKVDEFNALTQEMTQAEREKVATEQLASDMIDKRNVEEEILEKIKQSLRESEEGSRALEREIQESVRMINEEGIVLQKDREAMKHQADVDVMRVYERLFQNKLDRVVVPLANRTCTGCHISLTAQHENVVRKGERLIFCEHCSRIHYWQEEQGADASSAAAAAPRRRRRLVNVT